MAVISEGQTIKGFVAYEGEDVVGCCIGVVSKPGVGELKLLYVKEAYRGKGYSDQLVEKVIAWLRDQEVLHPVLHVAKGNEKVIDYYRKFDFEVRRYTFEIDRELCLVKDKNMTELDYKLINCGREGIDSLESSWGKLMMHHEKASQYFKKHFELNTFESRKQMLKGKEQLSIFKAESKENVVGYVLVTVDDSGVAELDSLFVDAEYRGKNVGAKLVKLGLNWLYENSEEDPFLVVAEGNEKVFEFYRKIGFRFKRYEMHKL